MNKTLQNVSDNLHNPDKIYYATKLMISKTGLNYLANIKPTKVRVEFSKSKSREQRFQYLNLKGFRVFDMEGNELQMFTDSLQDDGLWFFERERDAKKHYKAQAESVIAFKNLIVSKHLNTVSKLTKSIEKLQKEVADWK